jgi:hypothetical protein
MIKCSEENLFHKCIHVISQKECKSKKCGMWPWRVPKWTWFLVAVAVKPFRDLATLMPVGDFEFRIS